MHVLYCTTVLPSQRRTGGEIASQAFVDALRSAGHTVSVLGYRRPDDMSPLGLGEALVGVRPIESDSAGFRSLAWMMSALLTGRPYSCEKYVSAAYRHKLQTLLVTNPRSLVVIDHAQAAFLVADLPRSQNLVFVAHNVESELYGAQKASQVSRLRGWLVARESKLIGALEMGLASRARQTWVLTEHDAATFKRSASNSSVIRCDLPGLARTASQPLAFDDCWDIGLIGTWTWGANAQGLRWFMERVVPLLPGGLRIAVAGKGADGIVQPPVNCLGFVPDAMEFMRSSRVVCIPSVAGGGVQIKTIDAIASGRPIVATSIALRGIEAPPNSVVVCDDPERFAACILGRISTLDRYSQEAVEWACARGKHFEAQIRNLIGQICNE